jgi:hypothetical protein
MKKVIAKGLALAVIGMGVMLGGTGVCSATPVTWSSNGHQYEVVGSGSISWDNARQAKQNRGTGWDLATITSLDEQNFITGLLGPADGKLVEYYIGGMYAAGAWAWVTNEPFEFYYWGNGEPNGNASEPRMALDGRYNKPNWGWNDYTGDAASFVAGYVAENNATAPVPEPATMLLMGTGLAGLAGVARRRRFAKKI